MHCYQTAERQGKRRARDEARVEEEEVQAVRDKCDKCDKR